MNLQRIQIKNQWKNIMNNTKSNLVLNFVLILGFLVIMLSGKAYAADQTAPSIFDVYPSDNLSFVDVNTNIKATIEDMNGDAITWDVSLFDGDNEVWTDLSSGSSPSGKQAILLNVAGGLRYESHYILRISATDLSGSANTTEQMYSFTTRKQANYAPMISNPNPANNQIDVPLSPVLQANIYDVDKDSVNWKILLNDGNGWSEVASGTDATGNFTASATAAAVNKDLKEYTWKITAVDATGSGNNVEQIYSFKTKSSISTPTITNVSPADNSEDVMLSPDLIANIYDQDGKSLNWTVQMFDSSMNDWVVLGSGADIVGNFTINVTANMVNQFNTDYLWKITVVDTLAKIEPVEQVYSFKSRIQSYPPVLANISPKDGETAVTPKGSVSVYVDELYRDNKTFNITISASKDGTNYQTINKLSVNRPNGTFTGDGKDFFTSPLTTYFWKVKVTDSEGLVNEQVYSFRTGGGLTLKWNVSFANEGDAQIMPVMGDINNDGTQDIIINAGADIIAYNGKTGEEEWRQGDSATSAPELADLNNDGIPEVLYAVASGGPRLRAVNGDGTIRWTTPKLNGDGQSMFPIASYDIDGSGYPTIYFASEDSVPDPYDGNIADYNGALTMINASGTPLKSTWLHHPCWGGIAIGDTNSDGVFEVFVSDRRAGYHGFPAKGIQAFNAHNLELIWNRSDIMHSSPMPVLADVNGDGIEEVIATKITNQGPMILNAQTGATIADYSALKLPTHGTPTVYDIDHDGNLEAIYATAYPDSAAPEFAVFDLVTGQTEFRPVLNYQVSWPPEVGNVIGDNNMEILASTGSQGFRYGSYPLLIYDDEYNLIDKVTIRDAGQLMPARVFDVDNDGLNEVVIAGMKGTLNVYDTAAATSSPAPRTWKQRYSESRLGAAEYVAQPGPQAPVITGANPSNLSINLTLNPFLSIKVKDYQNDTFSVKFEISADDSVINTSINNISNNTSNSTSNSTINATWQTVKTFSNNVSGTFIADASNYFDSQVLNYRWRVTVQDNEGNKNSQIFYFDTKAILPSCGDNICNGDETCSSCSTDCGTCTVPSDGSSSGSSGGSHKGGGSGGGGGGSGSGNPATTPKVNLTQCIESWSCEEWTTCTSSQIQQRICTDINKCGTSTNKPLQTRDCVYNGTTKNSPIINHNLFPESTASGLQLDNQTKRQNQTSIGRFLSSIFGSNNGPTGAVVGIDEKTGNESAQSERSYTNKTAGIIAIIVVIVCVVALVGIIRRDAKKK
jgi:hypothetical protein